MKSLKLRNKAQRKVNYKNSDAITMYEQKLSGEIMTQNYYLVYYVAQKCVNYRDTGVSKNTLKTKNCLPRLGIGFQGPNQNSPGHPRTYNPSERRSYTLGS